MITWCSFFLRYSATNARWSLRSLYVEERYSFIVALIVQRTAGVGRPKEVWAPARHGNYRHVRGRPAIARETRDQIRRMCRDNPTWGAPRIHGELLKLGIDIGDSSFTKYMLRCRKPPSQTWRTS